RGHSQSRSSRSGVAAIVAVVVVVVLFVAVIAIVAVAGALALVTTAVVVAVVVTTVVVAVVVVAPAVPAVTSPADDLAELGLAEDVDVRAAGLVELDHGGASFFARRSYLPRPCRALKHSSCQIDRVRNYLGLFEPSVLHR